MRMTQNRMDKLLAHLEKDPLSLPLIQGLVNLSNVISVYWHLKDEDEDRARKVYTFVIMRNLIKIQNFAKSVIKMRHEASQRI